MVGWSEGDFFRVERGERVVHGPDGLVRIALKKPFSNGTFAVDLDPLSLLTRLFS